MKCILEIFKINILQCKNAKRKLMRTFLPNSKIYIAISYGLIGCGKKILDLETVQQSSENNKKNFSYNYQTLKKKTIAYL